MNKYPLKRKKYEYGEKWIDMCLDINGRHMTLHLKKLKGNIREYVLICIQLHPINYVPQYLCTVPSEVFQK